MPEPKQNNPLFLVIAYSHDNFRVWARQYGLASSYLTYISETSITDGYRDHTLVVLPGCRIDQKILARLYEDAKEVVDTRVYYPVSQAGRIVRWEKFKKP